ncbi:uncharacterized protein TRIADDRAFT_58641 [Trichoplax adhaerens]|uniref:R3H domain-containing protein n=1 Tax=Trichoplax adhaerens TaxID=10228 RepID=B3S396_TRIAD|nr:hypothetical protein TRIADDRAFT_58641 [Trichoplax adhaerens]EDV22932.1 hypothetical protein TRIADDRAFT_58641 [Trichoplax adhaerens]|eukprot:XP_002114798.1 hypothetical protein TRIADDRAFT_58641 [Trichoplax adhaerens]
MAESSSSISENVNTPEAKEESRSSENDKSNDRKSNQKRPTAEIYVPRQRREADIGKEKKSKSGKKSKKKNKMKPIETGPPKKAVPVENANATAGSDSILPDSISNSTVITEKENALTMKPINEPGGDVILKESSKKGNDDIANEINNLSINQNTSSQDASTTVQERSTQAVEVESPTNSAESAQAIFENHESSEEEWEKCFDESGECLDAKLMKELRNVVPSTNKMQLKQAVNDYSNYDIKDEYSHVLEMYDFSEALQTSDLNAALNGTGCKDFVIRWTDDTHALIVLSDSHAESFQPFKARPETSAATARRMVATHLGVRPNISREQRKMEMQKVKEAREQKKREAEQKRSIWDG